MERISALGHLTDKGFVVNILKNTPIIKSKVLGNITLHLIDRATDPAASKTNFDLDIAQVKGVFKDSDTEDVLAFYNSANQCVTNLNNINQSFIEKAGNEYNINFDAITDLLTHLVETIKKYGHINTQVLEPTADPSTDEPTSSNNITPNQNESSVATFDSKNMRLSSRQDVELCFNLICNYYDEFEPSSPIPILINRSKKLVNLDFLDIVKDIFPDALEQVQKLGGISEDESSDETSSSKSGGSW